MDKHAHRSASSRAVSRRRVLSGAVALGAAAGISALAPRAGATTPPVAALTPADLAADAAAVIQDAIDAMSASGGGEVRLPAGDYQLEATLQLKDNVVLVGAGMVDTTLRDADSLGARPILLALGAPDQPRVNVGVRDLTVRNGAATTGLAPKQEVTTALSSVGKDGLYAEYVDGVELANVQFTEIAGIYGAWFKVATDVRVASCRFYRCTYAMLSIQIDCADFHIHDCVFDTLVSTTYPQNYTLHMGGDHLNQGMRWAENVVVEDNQFRNNLTWEGIDCHGGRHLKFLRNRVENCYTGIMVANVLGYVADPVLDDVLIEGNTVVQGASAEYPPGKIRQHTGIVVAGAAGEARSRNVRVIGNTVVGFGGQNPLYGGILLERTQDVLVEGNDIHDFGQHAVVFGPSVFGAVIRGNQMRNVVAAVPGMEGDTAAIAAYSASGGTVFGAVIEGNRVIADDDSKRPQWFVYAPSPFASWQIAPDNDTSGVAQPALYDNVDYLPVDRETAPADYLVQRRGDRIYAANGRPGWAAVAPALGFGSLDTNTVVVAVDMAAGSRSATIVPGGAENYTVLPPDMNIVVAGAGEDGSDLRARIVEIVGTAGMTLDRPARQDVSGAAVRYGPLKLRPLPRGPRP